MSGSDNIITRFFKEYGLGFVIAAGFFGSGTIYILCASGVEFGYKLLWAIVLSGLVGIKAQSMSILLGIHRKPLMTLISEKIGRGPATIIAVYLCCLATLWILQLRAADGMALSYLLGQRISWIPLNYVVMILAIVFVTANVYSRLEKFITGILFITVLCFIGIAFMTAPEAGEFLSGFVPRLSDPQMPARYLILLVSIVGTTVLWPNFFLQSTIVKEKGWINANDYRFAVRDTVLGFTVGVMGSGAILIGSAAIIRPLGIATIETFITPALVLSETIGYMGSVLFLVGLFLAAFNSSIVITTTMVYILHQAVGKPVKFGDRSFLALFIIISVIGSLFPEVTRLTGLSVVDAIILFPGVNGALGLPLVMLLMFGFKYALSRDQQRPWRNLSNLADVLIVLLTFIIAARSIKSLVGFFFTFS